MELKESSCVIWECKLYIAGDISIAKQFLRKECHPKGLCVTFSPVNFIYTVGEEPGICVGFINYTRFPIGISEESKEFSDFKKSIIEIANNLMIELCQRSCSVIFPDHTHYLSLEK